MSMYTYQLEKLKTPRKLYRSTKNQRGRQGYNPKISIGLSETIKRKIQYGQPTITENSPLKSLYASKIMKERSASAQIYRNIPSNSRMPISYQNVNFFQKNPVIQTIPKRYVSPMSQRKNLALSSAYNAPYYHQIQQNIPRQSSYASRIVQQRSPSVHIIRKRPQTVKQSTTQRKHIRVKKQTSQKRPNTSLTTRNKGSQQRKTTSSQIKSNTSKKHRARSQSAKKIRIKPHTIRSPVTYSKSISKYYVGQNKQKRLPTQGQYRSYTAQTMGSIKRQQIPQGIQKRRESNSRFKKSRKQEYNPYKPYQLGAFKKKKIKKTIKTHSNMKKALQGKQYKPIYKSHQVQKRKPQNQKIKIHQQKQKQQKQQKPKPKHNQKLQQAVNKIKLNLSSHQKKVQNQKIIQKKFKEKLKQLQQKTLTQRVPHLQQKQQKQQKIPQTQKRRSNVKQLKDSYFESVSTQARTISNYSQPKYQNKPKIYYPQRVKQRPLNIKNQYFKRLFNAVTPESRERLKKQFLDKYKIEQNANAEYNQCRVF